MRQPWKNLAQLALDFFTGGEPSAPAVAPAEPRAHPQPPAPPIDHQHPRANRQTLLHGVSVAYRLERSRRKSIGFGVGPEGLVVRSPHWLALREVEAAVQGKAGWILAKLQQMQARGRDPVPAHRVWAHGTDLPYLGATVRLCVLVRGQMPDWPEGVTPLPLSLPPEASATQVREAAEAWFKQQARVLFDERLRHFEPLLGVRHRRLSLSSARTRWGSARADGHIRLNWRLIHLPLAQIDYVVVHELAHLRVMDHSPRFWDAVGEVMPDYSERRRALRAHALAEGVL
ncbi:MAG: M48 family metallopeptidase [Betaproteobacteria bacterium]|nr:M48 family metallopeptidase [Betaproteobacteria bacterium]